MYFWRQTFVPTSWMCEKQTSVTHRSTESEVLSLDAGLRMDGIFPLDLWDLVFEVLHSSKTLPVRETPWRDETPKNHTNIKTKKHVNRDDVESFNVDHVTTNAKPSHVGALRHVFEDNEAVIKMIIEGRSPTMRHVSRTHRVALDWLFDRIHQNPNQIH